MDICAWLLMMFLSLWVASALTVLLLPHDVHCLSAQTRLLNHLLADYNPMVRPRYNESQAVSVQMDVAVSQLLEMNEHEQILKTRVWYRLFWTDDILRWNASEWGGVKKVHIESSHAWHPDILLHNDVVGEPSELYSLFSIAVSNDGSVVWLAATTQFSACALDVTYFPWDVQVCEMIYGSWVYNGFELDLTNRSAHGDIDTTEINAEWSLKSFPVYRRVKKYNCCPEPYTTLSFYLVLQRKPMYFVINIILPACFLLFTSMLVFMLPSDSGEKISLSLTMLLASTVFLLIVSEILPRQSDTVPLIGMIFLVQIAILSMSSGVTVLVLRIHYRGSVGDRCPYWLRVFAFKGLARITCMTHLVEEMLEEALPESVVPKENGTYSVTTTELPRLDPQQKCGADTQSSLESCQAITESCYYNKKQYEHAIDNQHGEFVAKEWSMVAMVLDWFLFGIFFLTSLIATIVIIVNRPDMFGATYQSKIDEIPPGQWD